MSDKDKETLKDHVSKASEAMSKSPTGKKAQDGISKALNTVSKVANSPEAKVAAGLAGEDAKEKVETLGKIVDVASKSPLVVGEKNADKNKEADAK